MEEINFKCQRSQCEDDGVSVSECDFEAGIWLHSKDAGEQCFVKLSDNDVASLHSWLSDYIEARLS